jgi:hypothetical protein
MRILKISVSILLLSLSTQLYLAYKFWDVCPYVHVDRNTGTVEQFGAADKYQLLFRYEKDPKKPLVSGSHGFQIKDYSVVEIGIRQSYSLLFFFSYWLLLCSSAIIICITLFRVSRRMRRNCKSNTQI